MIKHDVIKKAFTDHAQTSSSPLNNFKVIEKAYKAYGYSSIFLPFSKGHNYDDVLFTSLSEKGSDLKAKRRILSTKS